VNITRNRGVGVKVFALKRGEDLQKMGVKADAEGKRRGDLTPRKQVPIRRGRK